MKVLVLGGTQFVGRHIVQAALDAGHDVTLFNRGQTNAQLFPEAHKIWGDRDGGLGQLEGDWDAIIDTCGYVPRIVKQSAAAFAQSAALYVFISTISVYAPQKGSSRVDERTPVATIANTQTEEITGETYGALKALCEHIIRDAFPTRSLFIRPGIIAGPDDPSDRFTYWVHRCAGGGRVLIPQEGTQPVQIIDARDLAQWTISLIEKKTTGFFNAVGPAVPITLQRMVEQCKSATAGSAELVWLAPEQLNRAGVDSAKFPLWLPNKDDWWIFSVDPARAISAGLTLRPISTTARDTLTWIREMGQSYHPKVGLEPAEEARIILAAYRETDEETMKNLA